jgi:hypothetical protein
MEEGVKIATQAKEVRTRRVSLNPHSKFMLNLRSKFRKSCIADFEENPRIAIAVKLAVIAVI